MTRNLSPEGGLTQMLVQAEQKKLYTPEDYLEFEVNSQERRQGLRRNQPHV
ncbi:hypothetical protein [Phormidium sp. CCY1219]|uniref:hypothetical protein n=1 Tax=Phormidium sp. CCY1219 TaxID=2886104 RepID=UPI002D1EA28F|nr:hypothetical protein [Phormidium sp. CCY1219]MEB3830255.1 hypothetical protein [Phormidium sp. CCY1219]